MFKKTALAVSTALFLAAGPAFAFQCPADVAAIDAALAGNPDLTEAQLAEVKELRDQGEELHSAGDHQESVDTLAKAKEILGIE